MTTGIRIAGGAILTLSIAALAGCAGGMVRSLEKEVVSSMQYDSVACPQLLAQRDALVAVHGDPATLSENEKAGARPVYVPVGIGASFPDMRGRDAKEHRRALGEIAAMDHSIERRACRGGKRSGRDRPF